MWQSVGIPALVVLATVVCALLFICFGWLVVWQLFLSKFKFLRELLGEAGTSSQATTAPAPAHSESQHRRSRARAAHPRAAHGPS